MSIQHPNSKSQFINKVDEFNKYMSIAQSVLNILEAQDSLEAYKDMAYPDFKMFSPTWEGESSIGEVSARLREVLNKATASAHEFYKMVRDKR